MSSGSSGGRGAGFRMAAAIARSIVDPVGGAVDVIFAFQGDHPQDARKDPEPVLEIIDVHDDEDSLGDQVRLINNERSGSTLTREITATREWRRSVTLGSTKTVSGSAGAAVGLDAVGAGLKASIEATLKENYSDETETKQVFSETITISVPPRTNVRVVLSWKALVRSGTVRITNSDRSVHDVPYRVVTGVTFDQTTEDMRGSQ